jgi:hypothetical protein
LKLNLEPPVRVIEGRALERAGEEKRCLAREELKDRQGPRREAVRGSMIRDINNTKELLSKKERRAHYARELKLHHRLALTKLSVTERVMDHERTSLSLDSLKNAVAEANTCVA